MTIHSTIPEQASFPATERTPGVLPPHRARVIGDFLLEMASFDHQYQAAWAFLSAAEQASSEPEVHELIGKAGFALRSAEKNGTNINQFTKARLTSRLLPSFSRSIRGYQVDTNEIHSAYMQENARFLDYALKRRPKTPLVVGGELATLGILSYSSVSRGTELIAWPRSAWDMTGTHRAHGLSIGAFPAAERAVRIEAGPAAVADTRGTRQLFLGADIGNTELTPHDANLLLDEEGSPSRRRQLHKLADHIISRVTE